VTPRLGPSSTLRRAAEAERRRLARTRDRLVARQDQLKEELARIEADLDALREREEVLAPLIGEGSENGHPTTPDGEPSSASERLKGAALRERAARRYYLVHGAGRALHYRRWFDLLLDEGVEIVGKDPLATFLTNLNRSPVVVRGEESGTYAIDEDAPGRLRDELSERQAELRDLTEVIARDVTPTSELQEHRAALLSDIRRLESLIAEAERVLAPAEAAVDDQERAERAA
jgi:hypothetical protein